MKNKELDKLLKQCMGKDFTIPDQLDNITRQKISVVNKRKEYRLLSLLTFLSLFLTVSCLIALWPIFPDQYYKLTVLWVCFSILNLLLLCYIMSYQSFKRKETCI